MIGLIIIGLIIGLIIDLIILGLMKIGLIIGRWWGEGGAGVSLDVQKPPLLAVPAMILARLHHG